MIGFKAAMREFEKKLAEHGGCNAQILFCVYPDGSLSPYLNGRLSLHHTLAAIRVLSQIAAEQAAEVEATQARTQGPSMPINGRA
jgi:hypothetical protein